ncbi:MAG TPA: hypothetical protein VG755_24465 [Nannocystaceae bacterium]|nr:hypothetical protein [Nannocystaceae bacterium]
MKAVRIVAALALLSGCKADAGPDEGAGSDTGTSGSGSSAGTTATTSAASSTSPTTSSTGPADDSSGSDSADASDGGSSSTGEAGLVPMFVAQGMLGRTTISCDDGTSWIADRSWDQEGDPLLCGSTDPIRCDETACQYLDITGECATSDPCDCGHNPGFAKGIAYGSGHFVATWGWGHPGSIRRSKNGIDWEETLSGEDAMFGGLVFGADTFVLSSRYPYHSNDGTGWIEGDEADFRGPGGEIVWSVRRLGFVDVDGGRFVATANPPQSVLITKDLGATWIPPLSIDDACLASVGSYGGIASGNGVIVGVGDDGVACRSTDGGDTWTLGSVGGEGIYARVLWTGDEFVTWAPGVRYTSPDGETWSSTTMTPEGVWLGAVAQSEATGTFAANGRVWDAYENQSFYRSSNGVDWEVLPAGSFTGGHYIFEMAFGWAEPSELCPR